MENVLRGGWRSQFSEDDDGKRSQSRPLMLENFGSTAHRLLRLRRKEELNGNIGKLQDPFFFNISKNVQRRWMNVRRGWCSASHQEGKPISASSGAMVAHLWKPSSRDSPMRCDSDERISRVEILCEGIVEREGSAIQESE
jgi:hypothetical protein